MKEALSGVPIPARLEENVDRVTALVDRSPEIVPLTSDGDEELVEVPGVARWALSAGETDTSNGWHMRELIEQGFDVTVVSDATAAAKTPDLGDGYAAALTNFRFIANAVVTTKEARAAMGADV